MDYYEKTRQYDALNHTSIKFPTRTNLVSRDHGKLSFGSKRKHADIDVSVIAYHDQKEFFRLDRQHDEILMA